MPRVKPAPRALKRYEMRGNPNALATVEGRFRCDVCLAILILSPWAVAHVDERTGKAVRVICAECDGGLNDEEEP